MLHRFFSYVTIGVTLATLSMPLSLSAAKPPLCSITLVDTTDSHDQLYTPLLQACLQTGITIRYLGIDKTIDWNPTDKELQDYDGFFFILGKDTVQGIMRQAPLARHVQKMIARCSALQHKLVGLFIPTLSPNTIDILDPLWQAVGLPPSTLNASAPNSKDPAAWFLFVARYFAAHAPEMRPKLYHTTLQTPHSGSSFLTNSAVQQWLAKPYDGLYLLPLVFRGSPATHHMLPLGVYWYNQQKKNHLFISHTSIASYAGITENFHVCPTDPALRTELNQALARMAYELRFLAMQRQLPRSPEVSAWCLKHAQTPLSITQKKRGAQSISMKKKQTTAWMELTAYEDPVGGQFASLSAEKKLSMPAKQQQLVDFIFDGKLDNLWISISPNLHYSPIGRAKTQKEQSLQTIGRFTKKLQETAAKRSKQPPRVLVGFEIANNLYTPNLPATPAYDLYDNRYYDIPPPLDDDFWHNEVIMPLQRLAADWQNPDVSNGVPLGGVVIDFEMYCRQQTGMFSSAMCFDARTFARFCQANNLQDPGTMHARMQLLLHKKLGAQYFAFVEQQAYLLGKRMHEEFTKLIPNCMIMCYAPHIPVNWFYVGLLRGLCSKKHTVHLLTFNNEWQEHRIWLRSRGIKATHANVLMLSKIKDISDLRWIDRLSNEHDGIWLNRFSRMIEPKATDWTGVEQPGMPETQYPLLLEKIAAIP